MNWYLTKIVFRIFCSKPDHQAQFEEQLRVICADNAEAALEKARLFALDETNRECDLWPLVKWQFVNVTELYRLSNFVDGAEIFSQFREVDQGDLYEEQMHRKAAHTRYNLQNRLLEIF
jgi:hypothetical protein